jgi:hypothetical protein
MIIEKVNKVTSIKLELTEDEAKGLQLVLGATSMVQRRDEMDCSASQNSAMAALYNNLEKVFGHRDDWNEE